MALRPSLPVGDPWNAKVLLLVLPQQRNQCDPPVARSAIPPFPVCPVVAVITSQEIAQLIRLSNVQICLSCKFEMALHFWHKLKLFPAVPRVQIPKFIVPGVGNPGYKVSLAKVSLSSFVTSLSHKMDAFYYRAIYLLSHYVFVGLHHGSIWTVTMLLSWFASSTLFLIRVKKIQPSLQKLNAPMQST